MKTLVIAKPRVKYRWCRYKEQVGIVVGKGLQTLLP